MTHPIAYANLPIWARTVIREFVAACDSEDLPPPMTVPVPREHPTLGVVLVSEFDASREMHGGGGTDFYWYDAATQKCYLSSTESIFFPDCGSDDPFDHFREDSHPIVAPAADLPWISLTGRDKPVARQEDTDAS